MQSVIMLSVIMLGVIMVNVVAPIKPFFPVKIPFVQFRLKGNPGSILPGFYGRKHIVNPGNTKGGSITVPLTSCLTGLD
jgi:hypothetical protein